MENKDKKFIEDIVRKVLLETLNKDVSVGKFKDDSGIISVKLDTVKLEKFDTGAKDDNVFLKDVLTLEESPRLGCGLMEMKNSSFDWTLKYDEIDYVIEGTLEILINGRKVIGNKGDIIYIPKDSSIKFSAPDYAKFLYVTYPANWAEQ